MIQGGAPSPFLAGPRALLLRDTPELCEEILGAWSKAFPKGVAPEAVGSDAEAEARLHEGLFNVILFDATRRNGDTEAALARFNQLAHGSARIAVLDGRASTKPPRGAHASFRAEHTSPAILAQSVEEAMRIADLERRAIGAMRARDITVLAGSLAHSFNNHLGTIIGHISLAAGRLATGKATGESLDVALAAAEDAARETATFQAAIQSGAGTSSCFDLGEMLSRSVRSLESRCRARLSLILPREGGPWRIRGSERAASHLLEALIRAADDAQARSGFITMRVVPSRDVDSPHTPGVTLRVEHGGTEGLGEVALTPATAILPTGVRWPVIYTLAAGLRAELTQAESPNHMAWVVRLPLQTH